MLDNVEKGYSICILEKRSRGLCSIAVKNIRSGGHTGERKQKFMEMETRELKFIFSIIVPLEGNEREGIKTKEVIKWSFMSCHAITDAHWCVDMVEMEVGVLGCGFLKQIKFCNSRSQLYYHVDME